MSEISGIPSDRKKSILNWGHGSKNQQLDFLFSFSDKSHALRWFFLSLFLG